VIPTLVDYSKPETLDAAFKGVEDFYFAQTQTPELFEEAKLVLGTLIHISAYANLEFNANHPSNQTDIGARSGAKHVVHISSNAQNAAIGKEHTEIENYAKGLGLSVVRRSRCRKAYNHSDLTILLCSPDLNPSDHLHGKSA